MSLPTLSAERSPPHSARSYVNPYVMPDGSDLFRYREELDLDLEAQWNKTRQMSLVQRANREKPPVPSLTSRGTIAFRTSKSKIPSESPSEPRHATRHKTMPEFICEKREIFIIQLMIQRKRSEMSDLSAEVDKEKQRFLDSEREISELANEYKLKSATVEASVAHARKECEAATRRRMDFEKQYQLTRQRVALTRAQISKNQNTVDDYHRYCDFIERMTPDGAGSDFFSEPADLIREIENLESGTVFLLRQCEALGIKVDSGIAKIGKKLSRMNADLIEIKGKLDGVPTVTDFSQTITNADVKRAEEIDGELVRLRAMIGKVHESCFGSGGATIPALLMMERIETGLEGLYDRLTKVCPAFAEAKQKKKDAERLEQYKLDVAERKIADQRLKIDAAIERAQMPIVRRTGRPLIKRMLPITFLQKDPEKSRAERRERERIDKLLYGSVWD
jgi:hypothetical protein